MKYPFPKVSVVGLGYIGLPAAAVLASRGIEVIGVDVRKEVVAKVNDGAVHFVEPDLDILVQGAVAMGKLRATVTPEPADAFVIAVPTPFHDGRTPDLSYVQAAAGAIAPVLAKDALVILESTSPVGTTEKLRDWLAAARPDLRFPGAGAGGADVAIAYCPERVLPGHILRELVENARVIGGLSPACAERAVAFYKTFVQADCVVTDARTAEMAKLTENSFRDVNIAFANELSMICDRLGIDVWELIELANRHPRVNILKPGPGVGGHCIAVDPWFIVASAPEESHLIRCARDVNDAKPGHVIAKVRRAAARFRDPTLAVLGLTYKPDVDDLRESPALSIAEALADEGLGRMMVVEPFCDGLPATLAGKPGVEAATLDAALASADVVLLLVDHAPFKSIDRAHLLEKVVIDTRGVWR